jgi:hypothetical protein
MSEQLPQVTVLRGGIVRNGHQHGMPSAKRGKDSPRQVLAYAREVAAGSFADAQKSHKQPPRKGLLGRLHVPPSGVATEMGDENGCHRNTESAPTDDARRS